MAAGLGPRHATAVVRVDSRPWSTLPQAVVRELNGSISQDDYQPAAEISIGFEGTGEDAVVEEDEWLERDDGGSYGGEKVAFPIPIPTQNGDEAKQGRIPQDLLDLATLNPLHDDDGDKGDEEEFVEKGRQRQAQKAKKPIAGQKPPKGHQGIEKGLGMVKEDDADREENDDGGPAERGGDAKHAEEKIHGNEAQGVSSNGNPVDETVNGKLVLSALGGTNQRAAWREILGGG